MRLNIKYLFFFLFAIIINTISCKTSSLSICKPTSKEAAVYYNLIIDQQNIIANKIDELIDSYNRYIPIEMKIALDSAVYQTYISIDIVTNLNDFDENSDFKDAALSLFNIYKSVLEYEHKEMVEIYSLSENGIYRS